jgi:hypothetical protein
MVSHSVRTNDESGRAAQVAGRRLPSRGAGSPAPLDLPLDQAMSLSQFPRTGILDVDLARRLGMSQAEASKMRGILLRRKLLRRTPEGRPRAGSRLLLTRRGMEANTWLEQLQSSLSPDLFESAGPELVSADQMSMAVSDGAGQGAVRRGPLAAMRRRWRSRRGREGIRERTEEGIFEQGMLYVWLGTASFGGAALVGVLLQTERGALVALGVGCLLAVIFFGRAGLIAFRNWRSRERRPRHWALHRPRFRSHGAAH